MRWSKARDPIAALGAITAANVNLRSHDMMHDMMNMMGGMGWMMGSGTV